MTAVADVSVARMAESSRGHAFRELDVRGHGRLHAGDAIDNCKCELDADIGLLIFPRSSN